jgi:hypothetical protein
VASTGQTFVPPVFSPTLRHVAWIVYRPAGTAIANAPDASVVAVATEAPALDRSVTTALATREPDGLAAGAVGPEVQAPPHIGAPND